MRSCAAFWASPRPCCPSPCPTGLRHGADEYPRLEALAGVPVCGAAGDQQAALFGQTCFDPGEAKNTYGTGCFTLMNVGEAVRSRAGLVTSVAWQVNGAPPMPWRAVCSTPAAPSSGCGTSWASSPRRRRSTCWPTQCRTAAAWWWYPPSRAWVRLTGICTPGALFWALPGHRTGHIARAVLSCIAAQVTDLMLAMRQDAGCDIALLRADGGASVSDVLLQMQADLLRIPVDRPEMVETTAFGAAALAGLSGGFWWIWTRSPPCAAARDVPAGAPAGGLRRLLPSVETGCFPGR